MSAVGGGVVGAAVLDLFAGSGALGLEALSRGADRVTFVERHPGSLKVLRANIAHLGCGDEVQVLPEDVFRAVARMEAGAYDLAFADPPYGTPDAGRLVALFLERPFAKELWLEHPWREQLAVPEGARTRRYGDTALTTLTAPS